MLSKILSEFVEANRPQSFDLGAMAIEAGLSVYRFGDELPKELNFTLHESEYAIVFWGQEIPRKWWQKLQ